MNSNSKKQAIVVIHGIGNQNPMETTKSLVENLNKEHDIIYSSPDRINNFYETRRLSIAQKNTDFFEYYWANLVVEPSKNSIIKWLFTLVFKKKSERFMNFVVAFLPFALSLIILLVLLSAYIPVVKYSWVVKTSTFATFLFLFVKYIVPNINSMVSQSIGDALRYLQPNPQNIESRFLIRNKGLKLLKELHKKKDENGDYLYDRIVIVGHSLGSVIALDIINYLWHEFLYEYKNESPNQEVLQKMKAFIVAEHKKQENEKEKYVFNQDTFVQLQKELFNELKNNGNPWRIEHFVSLGSPLNHGEFLLANNFSDFQNKKRYREISLCPPKIEVTKTQKTAPIVKDYERVFTFKKPNSGFEYINHSSVFAFTQWTNIYFENDYIGGNISEAFGNGIKNIELKPKGKWTTQNLPLFSHTKYWEKEEEISLGILYDVILKREKKREKY